MCCENKFCCTKAKMALHEVKNIFASRTQILRPKHTFSSLAIMKTMSTRFKCCSLKKFTTYNGWPRSSVNTESYKQFIENWKGKEGKELEGQGERVTHSFVWRWNVVHGHCQAPGTAWIGMKRKWLTVKSITEIILVSQGNITKANGKFWDHKLWGNNPWNKSFTRLLRKSVFCIAHALLATEAAKHLVCFPLI